jgi:hypothetical protein
VFKNTHASAHHLRRLDIPSASPSDTSFLWPFQLYTSLVNDQINEIYTVDREYIIDRLKERINKDKTDGVRRTRYRTGLEHEVDRHCIKTRNRKMLQFNRTTGRKSRIYSKTLTVPSSHYNGKNVDRREYD